MTIGFETTIARYHSPPASRQGQRGRSSAGLTDVAKRLRARNHCVGARFRGIQTVEEASVVELPDDAVSVLGRLTDVDAPSCLVLDRSTRCCRDSLPESGGSSRQ